MRAGGQFTNDIPSTRYDVAAGAAFKLAVFVLAASKQTVSCVSHETVYADKSPFSSLRGIMVHDTRTVVEDWATAVKVVTAAEGREASVLNVSALLSTLSPTDV